MARIYYSKQYYNQLKKKYYEEYRRRQNAYYLYQRKYYEEYRRRQNAYNLYRRKYYEEYRKIQNAYYLYQRKYYEECRRRQNAYYLYQRKYYEEYLKRQNECNSYKKKHNEEYNKRNKNNSYDSLEINLEEINIEKINIEENNLEYKKDEDKNQVDKTNTLQSEFSNSFEPSSVEYKKDDSSKNDILEKKSCISNEDLWDTPSLHKTSSQTSDVTTKFVTVKIPVVLTECSITITVQSLIKLEDDVLEIKHVSKNVYLNQCKLIPNSENNKPNTGILFLSGVIRSNIEYSTKEGNDKGVLMGKLKYATVNDPFECTTRVTFNTPPKFKATTSQNEVEILKTNIEVCNTYEKEITGRDIREQSFRSIEFFNEKVFCELISAEFVESDILDNLTNKECKSPLEQTFHDITENVVLFLTIKLLQNQNVKISK